MAEVLPTLLAERGMSLRDLAASIGVSPGHLSRAVRQADGKYVSGALAPSTRARVRAAARRT
jgi:DNA-binding LacI/PurR family transcriptional regulator